LSSRCSLTISPPTYTPLWCPPRLSSWPSTLCHVYNPAQYSHLTSFLNHHIYADDRILPFLSISQISTHKNDLQQISSWMTANLLTLNSSKTEFLLIGLKQHSLKYTTPLSLQPTSSATLVLFLTNTLPSQTKSLHFLNLATTTFVNFAVLEHYLLWLLCRFQNIQHHCHLHCPFRT